MEYSMDQNIDKFINELDKASDHYIDDDFSMDELETSHTMLIDSNFEDLMYDDLLCDGFGDGFDYLDA